jgi:hypothetical protein
MRVLALSAPLLIAACSAGGIPIAAGDFAVAVDAAAADLSFVPCTAASLHTIETVSKWTVGPGDSVLLIIDLQCDAMSLYGAFESAQKTSLTGFACTATVGNRGQWTCEVKLPPDPACGSWSLRDLHYEDTADNLVNLDTSNPLVANVAFSVAASDAGACFSPPVATSVTVSPQSVSSQTGGAVTITIDVTDNSGSAVASVTGRADGPAPANGGAPPEIWFNAQLQATGGPWQAMIMIPANAAKGTWQIAILEVADKARNIAYYSDPSMPPLKGAVFQVQ